MMKRAKAIALTSLVAGTLDIAAAMLNFFIATGKNPARVPQFIASGVFGDDAFSDDALMPAYGLFFHYCVATSWTILFFIAYPKMRLLAKYRILNGVVYGIVVWIIMTQIVLPLSNVRQRPFNPGTALLGISILMVCIGLPISFGAEKFYKEGVQ